MRRIIIASVLDVAAAILPALTLASLLTYLAWCWSIYAGS